MPKSTDPRYLATNGEKLCNKCERMFPVASFYKRKSPDGYRNDCKDCVRDRSQDWYEKNQEHSKEKARTWYHENKERASERRAAWYERTGREQARRRRQKLSEIERGELNAQTRASRAADPERFQRYDLMRRLKKLSVTYEEYEELLAKQAGLCAICDGGPNGKDPVLHIDHDHRTGVLRGLLCHSCNTSLGHFRDDPKVLQRAINYLRNPPAQSSVRQHQSPR